MAQNPLVYMEIAFDGKPVTWSTSSFDGSLKIFKEI